MIHQTPKQTLALLLNIGAMDTARRIASNEDLAEKLEGVIAFLEAFVTLLDDDSFQAEEQAAQQGA